jgi:hypothetical protein
MESDDYAASGGWFGRGAGEKMVNISGGGGGEGVVVVVV